MPAFDRIRPLSVLAPILCDAGEPDARPRGARGLLEALGPGRIAARTRTALACVLHRSGEEAAAHAALAAASRGRRRGALPPSHRVAAGRAGALERARGGAVGRGGRRRGADAAFPGGPRSPRWSSTRSRRYAPARSPPRRRRVGRRRSPPRRERLPERRRCGRAVHATPPSLRFRTLGGSRYAAARTRGPRRWERKVAERVVRFLLVRGGELVPEDELFEAFWPEKPPGSARRGLQTAISSARAVLDLPWELSQAARAGALLRPRPARRRPRRRRRLRGGRRPRAGDRGARADRGDGGRCPALDRRAAARGALLRLGRELARAAQLPARRRARGPRRNLRAGG